MSDRKTTTGKWFNRIAIAAVIFAIAFFAWQLFFPHTFEIGPVPLSTAQRQCPFAFPNSARNIYIASHRHWVQTVIYIRFEAPPADCESCARTLMPSAEITTLDKTAAESVTAPFNPNGVFRDLSWFDLQNISRGKHFGEHGSGQSVIDIDEDRGIFYYKLAD